MKNNHNDPGTRPKLTKAQQELYDWLVQYIDEHRYSPSIRQMMEAMNLRSPAPVQSRLERLKSKGYIDWTPGKARTIAILHREPSDSSNIKIVGTIAAGGLVTPINDLDEYFGLADILKQPDCYALRVTGDSMIGDLIMEGDLVIMKSQQDQESLKNGQIVAAMVEGHGTTLKHFFRKDNKVKLHPSNSDYAPIEADASSVEVQGVLMGVWRNYRG